MPFTRGHLGGRVRLLMRSMARCQSRRRSDWNGHSVDTKVLWHERGQGCAFTLDLFGFPLPAGEMRLTYRSLSASFSSLQEMPLHCRLPSSGPPSASPEMELAARGRFAGYLTATSPHHAGRLGHVLVRAGPTRCFKSISFSRRILIRHSAPSSSMSPLVCRRDRAVPTQASLRGYCSPPKEEVSYAAP